MKREFLTAVGLVGSVGVLLAGCSGDPGDASLLERDSLVIAVMEDQPSIGVQMQAGEYAGFDVDVAMYVAQHLGFGADNLEFVTATGESERMLHGGEADLVVAAYSVTPQRKIGADFAGPYYVAHKDLVVSSEDSDVVTVADLEGRRLCVPPESISWRRIAEERDVGVERVDEPTFTDCLAAVRAGDADAVSSDNLILAGFLERDSAGLRLVNAPFTDERWGIAIGKGDTAACEELNRAISAMYQDGTAEALLQKWFGTTGLEINTSVPQFEGCT